MFRALGKAETSKLGKKELARKPSVTSEGLSKGGRKFSLRHLLQTLVPGQGASAEIIAEAGAGRGEPALEEQLSGGRAPAAPVFTPLF